jgi:hypothetical protein
MGEQPWASRNQTLDIVPVAEPLVHAINVVQFDRWL